MYFLFIKYFLYVDLNIVITTKQETVQTVSTLTRAVASPLLLRGGNSIIATPRSVHDKCVSYRDAGRVRGTSNRT